MIGYPERVYDLDDRLDKYTYYDPNTGCWLWVGSLYKNGYGKLTINHKTYLVHRLTWKRERGDVPDGLELDHLRRQRACRSPYHLEPKTRQANVLAGAAPTAGVARTNICLKGHELTPDNIYWRPDGKGRTCYTCARERNRRPRRRSQTQVA